MKRQQIRRRLLVEDLESRLVLAVFLPNIYDPVGVTTDANNNVFVSWYDASSGGASVVSKFDSSGNVLGGIVTDTVLLDGPGSLITYPAAGKVLSPGQIVDLIPNGVIAVLNPDLSGGNYLSSLQNVPTDVSNVYDVYAQQFHNDTGLITPNTANYGDIAIFVGGQYEDWFVTGISNGLPFVERLRWQGGQLQSIQVVATSAAAQAGFNDLPRGVAVNSQGVVLTTFPFLVNPADNPLDYLVAFSDNFTQDRNFLPYRPFGSDPSTACFSRGMTADNSGNFLVATGSTGSSLTGAGAGIVFVPADLSTPQGIPLSNSPSLPIEDVALTPDDSLLYLTIGSSLYSEANQVWVFNYGIGARPKTGHPKLQLSLTTLSAGLYGAGDAVFPSKSGPGRASHHGAIAASFITQPANGRPLEPAVDQVFASPNTAFITAPVSLELIGQGPTTMVADVQPGLARRPVTQDSSSAGLADNLGIDLTDDFTTLKT